jgi:hypothetical protein
LETVTEDCACYAFCDGTFVKCQSGEGGLLTSGECIGTPITGCNRAGVAGGSSSAQGQPSQSTNDDNTVVIAVAVAVPLAIAFFVMIYYFFTRKSKSELDKMNAGLEAESESPSIQNMEGSLSMADVPATPPAPPASSFVNSPIAADPENKVV